MVFGAILAGGTGSRMNMVDLPKQFLPLGNKPIIIHTLEKMLMCTKFDAVYVGVNPDWVLYMEDLVEKHIPDRSRVVLLAGGSDRNGTIFNIIDKIEQDHGESEEHVIVTHDAVRPFVTLRILNENVDSVLAYGACDTVIEATDTIVVSEDGEQISDIPLRSRMYQGQTPQSFNMNLLKKLYRDLSGEEKKILTDACKICVVRNTPVHLVRGEVSNLKITTISDYKVANAMIGGMED